MTNVPVANKQKSDTKGTIHTETTYNPMASLHLSGVVTPMKENCSAQQTPEVSMVTCWAQSYGKEGYEHETEYHSQSPSSCFEVEG